MMTRRAWRLVIAGYAILVVAWLIGAGWTTIQGREIDHNTRRLNDSTAGLCSAILQTGPENERSIIEALGRGELVPLPGDCRALLRRLRGDP